MLKKGLASVLAIGLVVGSLAACGGQQGIKSSTTPQKASSSVAEKMSSDVAQEKTITVAESFDFSKGFYPVFTESTSENPGITNWGHNFYDNLVKYENGEIKGSLAESWEISKDGKKYTFKLKKGVKFSDGSDFTANAVKVSFEQAIKNLGMYNGSFGRLSSLITSMEATDDNTFVMELSQSYYGTLNDLTMCTPLAIVNPKAFESDPFKACTEATMGTGPYMYESNDGGKAYKFVRNPYYWGENPEADSFVIKIIADNDSKMLALKNGEVDAIIGSSRISHDAFHEMSESGEFKGKVDERGNLTDYIGLNLSKEPFNDTKVRQAVSHAIDRNLISEKIYYGINAPALGLFEKTKPFCNVDVPVYEYDLEKANKLLNEAGWKDEDKDGIREKNGKKLEFTMSYTNAFGNRDDLMAAISGGLREVGISVKQEAMDMMSWMGPIMKGDYNITLYKTYGGAFDPTTVFTNMNPEVATDKVVAQVSDLLPKGLIAELDATSDIGRVQEIYKEVLETIGKEAAVVPIDTVREFGIWNKNKIADYVFPDDSLQIEIGSFKFK